ncbi:lytic polysaccharide monooxygenase [Streptomyces sp. NPDC003077]|uniref:lytic polysaccharide monooxygenase auxiliary activity family 9 protein n=1 Tax=Streptomyces sp. NPDC003077 TaxID=3154443 RepID=UPI00339F51EB
MSARRKAAALAFTGVAPIALTALAASPAVAHGSMKDPASRVFACYAEGPESPRSAACKAAVQAGGPQPLYDWNEVNVANAAGKSRQIIPDGKLCSAGNAKYRGFDLPRADWPATPFKAGKHTFRYKATAPHRGSFELYLTKAGYDPTKPLKWSDLEAKPFARVTDPKLVNGDYVFDGTVPARFGRHLIYSVWQRSDSPEAFYTCSDVVFGGSGGGAPAAGQGAGGAPAAGHGAGGASSGAGSSVPAPIASAPTDAQIAAGAGKSTVEHHGHGDLGHGTDASPAPANEARAAARGGSGTHGAEHAVNAAAPQGGGAAPVDGRNLAETGGDDSSAPIAVGGAAVVAVGAGVLFATARRKAARRG